MNFLPVAKLTFKELLKERTFFGLLVLEVFLIFVSKLLSEIVAGDTVKVAMDLSLTFFFFLVALYSIFSSVGSTFKDISQKVIYLILSKPIRRNDYIIGKFLGLTAAVAFFTFLSFLLVTTGILIISKTAHLYVSHTVVIERILSISFLNFVMGVFLSAFGILLSVLFSSQILAVMSVIFLFIAGLELSSVKELAFSSKFVSSFNKLVIKFAYYFLPNFSLFDLKDYAVHLEIHISFFYFVLAILYAFIYTLAVLTLACYLFERREL